MSEKRNSSVLIIVIIVLLLLGGAIAFWVLKKKSADSTPKPTPPTAAVSTSDQKGPAAEPPKVETSAIMFGKPVAFEKIDLTIKSATLTVGRHFPGTLPAIPDAQTKVLTVKFSVKNKWTTPFVYQWSTLSYAVRDTKGIEHPYTQYITNEDNEDGGCEIAPGGKVELITNIVIPADARPAMLIVRESETKVVMFDLGTNCTPLQSPFADPSDRTGTRPLAVIPGTLGEYYPIKEIFDIALTSIATSETNLGGEETPEGKTNLILTYSVKNIARTSSSFNWAIMEIVVVDKSGSVHAWNQCIYKEDANETIDSMEVEPGETRVMRHCVQVPANATSFKIAVRAGSDHRSYRYNYTLEPAPTAPAQ